MENTQQIVVAQMRRLVEEHGVPTEVRVLCFLRLEC